MLDNNATQGNLIFRTNMKIFVLVVTDTISFAKATKKPRPVTAKKPQPMRLRTLMKKTTSKIIRLLKSYLVV